MGIYIKPIFYFAVRKFVNREPQQIFMGENTEYKANLEKVRVNFPVTLLHIYWVCQYELFLTSEGWEGFTEPSKPSLGNIIGVIINKFPITVLYLVVLY